MYSISPSCQVTGLSDIYQNIFGDKAHGRFVDVGAFDGIGYSNTSCLAERDWEGLMIEPHPTYYWQCRDRYASYPKIQVLNYCIGKWDGKVTFYPGGCLSTTDPAIVDAYQKIPWAAGIVSRAIHFESNMSKLDSLLSSLGWPIGFDVLSIDTEGTEVDVLRGFDIKRWQPKLVIAEACEHHQEKVLAARAPEINAYFETAAYEKIYCDVINSIFVRA